MAEALPYGFAAGTALAALSMGTQNDRRTVLPPVSNSVRCIIMKYPDLNALLRGEPEARQFFDQLPDYVQSQIMTRAGGVNSLSSLKDYAENLTRGDG